MVEVLRKRLVADRFRRVWAVVEEIAARPGQTRAQLADKFHLSERQVQADLIIIRSDMRLPLIRRQGYRFETEGHSLGASTMSLGQAQMLVLLLAKSLHDRSVSTARVRALLSEIPTLCPPHLAPVVARLVEAVTSRTPSRHQRIIVLLTEAMLAEAWVTLTYDEGWRPFAKRVHFDPTIMPSVLLPYLDDWYVLGPCEQARGATRMLTLEHVRTVTPAKVKTDTLTQLGRAS